MVLAHSIHDMSRCQRALIIIHWSGYWRHDRRLHKQCRIVCSLFDTGTGAELSRGASPAGVRLGDRAHVWGKREPEVWHCLARAAFGLNRIKGYEGMRGRSLV
jgi:hypothetical protein